ncbi:U11/U12 small nuclear ribonucleoprotein 48 kDa protein-like [Babylonia areolata]|uniref:U11/U12 small nuclear ribonucleoprotein 48 kDa protein-like n=1 Tax=Babylonia areolata TaxID=304850 RepID=UPI003FD535DB
MMAVVTERVGDRKTFIAEIKAFIEKECTEIGELLSHLSWTPDHILKSTSVTQCPYDPGHQMPESTLKQHASVCHLKKMGLSTEELETELQNDGIFYKNADLVGKVQLDEGLLNRILWNHSMENRQVHMGHREMPVSGADWKVKLSGQERLAVYEHCVQTLKAQGKMANVERDEVLTTDWERIVKKGMLEQGGEKPKSKFELLAMLRDQKRRRATYRAKNVHVTKKSYTEIIREVIQNQMEIMMPSGEIKQEPQEDEETTGGDQDVSRHRQRSSEHSSSRNRSRSPRKRRSRSRSRSPSKRWHRSRKVSRSRSPQRPRSRSRSRSPRGKDRGAKRKRYEEEGPLSGSERKESPERSSHPDHEQEDGQIESDGSSSQHRRSHSKKKSSKHKKHKHKKHKSRSHRSDSD